MHCHNSISSALKSALPKGASQELGEVIKEYLVEILKTRTKVLDDVHEEDEEEEAIDDVDEEDISNNTCPSPLPVGEGSDTEQMPKKRMSYSFRGRWR